MWTTQASQTTYAPPEMVWAEWSSPGTWDQWVPVFKWAKFYGPFAENTRGEVQMQNVPGLIGKIMTRKPQKWLITEIVDKKIFNDYAPQFLAKVWFNHSLNKDAAGNTIITIEVRITGVLSSIYGALVGKIFKRILPVAIANLVKLIEAKSNK